MGYLDSNQEKLLKKDSPFDQSGGVAGSQVPLSGQSSPGFAGGGSGTKQAGTGGASQGWTNIQTYLNSNKGGQGTETALKNTVGGAFDTEKQNLNQSATQAKTTAEKQVTDNKIGTDQASKLISESAGQYNYDGPQSTTYANNTGKLKNSLGAQWKAPTAYGYGLGAQSQEYGTNLKTDQGFKSIMNALYNRSGGDTMSAGSRALQSQVDQDNPMIEQARQNLLNKYSGLTSDVESTVGDVNKAYGDYSNQFEGDKGNLKSWLEGQMGTDRYRVDEAVRNANAKKQQFLNWATPADAVGFDRIDPNSGINYTGQGLNYNRHSTADYIGNDPTMENIGGVENYRSGYNTINDILGGSERIGKSADWKLGDASVTTRKSFTDPTDGRAIFNGLEQAGFKPVETSTVKGEDFLKGWGKPVIPTEPVVSLPTNPMQKDPGVNTNPSTIDDFRPVGGGMKRPVDTALSTPAQPTTNTYSTPVGASTSNPNMAKFRPIRRMPWDPVVI